MISRIFIEPLLHIAVILPFLLLLIKDRTWANLFRIVSIAICYYTYSIALSLPKLIPSFNFINSRWNWDGKICGILCCIALFYIFRREFEGNNFFTFRQNKKDLKPTIMVATIVVIISAVIWAIFGSAEFNLESLLFQISLPGIDEEMMFRGILLGLMCSSLRGSHNELKNPAVITNAVLFGLMHALIFKNGSIRFDILYFLQTGLAGYVWAWVTLKSRSILLAVLSHNFSNFFGTLATMIK